VEIPEKVRAAAADGAGPDDRGSVILTPPGSGGDVHGDPGLGGNAPIPPTPGHHP
jgi:cell division protease FtsH